MGKWNCHMCGLYLEDKRHLAEFPLETVRIYCRDCAEKIVTARREKNRAKRAV
jgi:hypothetical protein